MPKTSLSSLKRSLNGCFSIQADPGLITDLDQLGPDLLKVGVDLGDEQPVVGLVLLDVGSKVAGGLLEVHPLGLVLVDALLQQVELADETFGFLQVHACNTKFDST